ncbi:hypothetical protein DFH07DRAFT_768544 [Mycena maculata]|uniref:Uncharacterized protein n=1 Tax=Mycena maculata TaxID=230809 RepID=A0AAD7JSL0_9AGAR|nr:hypothetical protein DFH07DRAFT_768544 [Mycena maculata]
MARTFKGTQYGNLNSLGSIFMFHRNPNKKMVTVMLQAGEKNFLHPKVMDFQEPTVAFNTTGWKKLLTTLEMEIGLGSRKPRKCTGTVDMVDKLRGQQYGMIPWVWGKSRGLCPLGHPAAAGARGRQGGHAMGWTTLRVERERRALSTWPELSRNKLRGRQYGMRDGTTRNLCRGTQDSVGVGEEPRALPAWPPFGRRLLVRGEATGRARDGLDNSARRWDEKAARRAGEVGSEHVAGVSGKHVGKTNSTTPERSS